jgi:hypothetical protein
VPRRLWARWKRFAHRAAVIQSHVLLSLLYWIVVAPIGAIQHAGHRRGVSASPSWTPRETRRTVTLEDARRQY